MDEITLTPPLPPNIADARMHPATAAAIDDERMARSLDQSASAVGVDVTETALVERAREAGL